MFKITTNKIIKKNIVTFVGRVQVYDDKSKKYLYSHSTGIFRLTKDDAKNDAKRLINNISLQSELN